MRRRMKRSAAATVVKTRRIGFRARVQMRRQTNGVRMLVDASIIKAMRRPGQGHFGGDEQVNGSATAIAISGTPARKKSSGRCRTHPTHDGRTVSQQGRHEQTMAARLTRDE